MRNNPKTIGVIPARFNSQRLPGKVLLHINGMPMIRWVYESAKKSPLLDELLVATDSRSVQQYCIGYDLPVMMTGEHACGSDRLHEVMLRTDGDVYVNIQGDEPTVTADHIALLLQPIFDGKAEVTTLRTRIDEKTAQNPNCVKVATDKLGRALYFSRFPIPFDRDGAENIRFYKHIGLYGYTRAALEQFHLLPQSPLELAEKLEQLRFLENGISLFVSETLQDTIGVDTEEDLERARAFLAAKNI
ncbi:MAG TPA: 3-deoxy-manno-octulosonate cytidylyltransferase [Acidobacteriota bacterium]|nr:3-deoxy-manno-octulosonate cytidylyltransferase [Acidobacteriota bacterium]